MFTIEKLKKEKRVVMSFHEPCLVSIHTNSHECNNVAGMTSNACFHHEVKVTGFTKRPLLTKIKR